jgi:hypothetical protein
MLHLVPGLTRYGICLNFYRPLETTAVNAASNDHDDDVWKTSTDSAFSR